ncbi:MAG TPA: hypothetical protein VFU46_03705 [Gemmatimonadales bacterium]|nr:hypothetical protein [Gemmatimonadales bacterium]
MYHRRLLGVICLLAACGGQSAGDAARAADPATSAEGAVRSFLQGVADSNLARMATYWGSTSGPAIRTNQPPDWERRMVIMQAYLRKAEYKIVSDVGGGADAATRGVQVELRRDQCTRVVPFTTVRAVDGSWIVNQVDLAAAGSPLNPCPKPSPVDSL